MAAAIPFIPYIIQGGSMIANRMSAEGNRDAQARQIHDEAIARADQQRTIAAQTMGRAKAVAGASGVSASSPSVLQVMRESMRQAELDQYYILRQGNVTGGTLDRLRWDLGAQRALQKGEPIPRLG